MRVAWDVAGHSAAVAALHASIAGGAVGHAYMLAGPRGIGKGRLAREFAKALLCAGTVDEAPCGVCRNCRRVQNGTHPDLHWVAPAGASLRIDQVRELQAQIALRPYEGRYKVCVVDDADTLTEQAQNSMLKVLEEPPGSGVFVLIAHNPDALLPTIHSRCQVLRLHPVPEAEIGELLRRERGMSAGEAALLAALSDGKPGRALTLDAQAVLAQRDKAAEWCAVLRQNGLKGVLQVAEQLEKEEELSVSLAAFTVWLRDIWHCHVGSGLPLVNRDKEAILRQEAKFWGAAAAEALAAVNEARQLLGRNANKRLVFDCMLMRIRRGIPA